MAIVVKEPRGGRVLLLLLLLLLLVEEKVSLCVCTVYVLIVW